MPIYEYYCPDNHTVYQFYAKTLAQGKLIPKCPDNPRYRMQKLVSSFAVTSKGKGDKESTEAANPAGDAAPAEDARMEAAMEAMEREFGQVDENDPKAMGRMMRRMAELTGEKLDGEMEEVVRKLEEGVDPDSLEEQFGGGGPDDESGEPAGPPEAGEDKREPRHRYKARRRQPARRDPKLYDYE